MNAITLLLEDGRQVECPPGTVVGTLAPAAAPGDLPYLGAIVNNDVASLSYPLTVNSAVRFITIADPHGWRVYRRSLCFLLAKTVRELFPNGRFRVEHALGQGLYCSFNGEHAECGDGIAREQVEAIQARMRELAEQNIPIERRKISYTDAVNAFETSGQEDKLNVFRHRNPPRVVIHWCDGFSDLAHGPLVPSTAALDLFRLVHYKSGFVLQLPDRGRPTEVAEFEDQPHLFQIIQEHKEWGRILRVNTAGRLNEIIARGEVDSFIRTAEALHEKKAARIADMIAEGKGRVKVILVAGPSCAGKTTFAKRLTVQLTVNGFRPVTVALDDYFVGQDRNPRDEAGNPDYEHVEAVDISLFNEHLLALIEGREIEVPHFNFELKQREFRGDRLRIEDDQVLIIEGIHGLNPKLTHMVPADRKFRIYVSALTQLSVDSNNRVSTTDNRLMRRIVRDHKYRGHSTLETLRLWPSVRRGEKRWIFPFQSEADATFNSALDYELAILKPLVEPLLMQVKPSDPEYAEARRLSEFLLNFLAAPPAAVPGTSILREYVGGSTFTY